jgi:hypothetical protein
MRATLLVLLSVVLSQQLVSAAADIKCTKPDLHNLCRDMEAKAMISVINKQR